MKRFEQRQDELVAASQKIMAKAESAGRDLTLSEVKEIKANTADFTKVKAQIEVRDAVAAQQTELKHPRAKASGQQSRLSGTHGFNAFGDFVMAVRNAGMIGGGVVTLSVLETLRSATCFMRRQPPHTIH